MRCSGVAGRSVVESENVLERTCPAMRKIVYSEKAPTHVFVYDDNKHATHCNTRMRTPVPHEALQKACDAHDGALTSSQAKCFLAETALVNEFEHKLNGGDINEVRRVLNSYHDGNHGSSWKHHLKRHLSKGGEQVMAQVMSMCEHMDKQGTKVLWYNGVTNKPDGTKFEHMLFSIADMGPATRRKPIGLRGRFTMVECLLQCMKGGRFYEVGLHVDATYNKIEGWEVIDVTTYDPDLGRIIELAFMVVRVHDGIGWKGKANQFVYKELFDNLFNLPREYLADRTMVVRYSHVVADGAGEITIGQAKSWNRHSMDEYPLDPHDSSTLAGELHTCMGRQRGQASQSGSRCTTMGVHWVDTCCIVEAVEGGGSAGKCTQVPRD